MAQSGYTPIQLYLSTTASAVPLAANLAAGELAINTNDGKLYYKNSAGVVTLLAGAGGAGIAAGSNTQLQFNNSGAFGASANLTWSGTVLSTTGLTATGAILHNTVANNQSYTTTGAGTITISSGTTGTIDGMNIGATTAGTGKFTAITNTGLTSGRVVYSTTGGLETDSANLTFDGTNLTLAGGTANGVAYLNGSKVLTTGSALVFDGTNLGIGASPSFALDITTSAANIRLAPAIGTNNSLTRYVNTGGTFYVGLDNSAGGISGAYNGNMFHTGAYSLVFGTNSLERMRIDSSGNVGIGTSSPLSKLHVNNTSTAITYATIGNNNGGTQIGVDAAGLSVVSAYSGLAIRFGNNSGATFAETMRLDSSGNLGIGTTSPVAKLQVTTGTNKNILMKDASHVTLTNLTSAITFSRPDGINDLAAVFGWNSGGLALAGRESIAFATGGSSNYSNTVEAMRIDSSGNVGIGTSSPSSTLSVTHSNGGAVDIKGVSTDGARIRLYNNAASTNQFQIGQGYSSGSDNVAYILNIANAAMFFATNNTERMRIDSSGNVLVGTTAQLAGTYRLVVNTTGSGSTAGALFVSNQSTVGNEPFSAWQTATTGDNVFCYFGTEASFTTRGSISYNRAGGLTVYNTTSDYRAKDIYGPVSDSGALIDSVPVYMGKMKGATQERPMFIAHETPVYAHTGEKDAVDKDGNPVYQQMDVSALIPVMWAEIQSLRKRLTALEST